MAGVNFKIGADASAFKQGVSEAQASLKTLDAALKVNEASFKAGGDAETYMSQKLEILNSKMTQQKSLANQLQAGLQKMRQAGVSPTSVEYQKLEKDLYNAQAAMNETKVAIDNLDGSQEKATGSAGSLTAAVNGIGKKISLDQVIGGIDRITGAMQTAAGAAVNLGEKIWDNVMNSAKWADDSSTMALMYGIDPERFLRMQKLVKNGMDTSVDAMLKSQTKLNKNIGDGNKDTLKYFRELGVAIATVTGESMDIVQRKDPADLFWEIGDALMHMGDAYDKEAASQAIFGRGWKELVPLFDKYDSRAEYEKALGRVKVNTEQEVNDLATLNDKVAELQGNIDTLTNKGWAALAPSLTGAAEALNGLLGSVLEYLDTPEGKEALQQMSESVSTLFEDLGKIDPKDVVKNFQTVFDKLVTGFEWIAEHKGDVLKGLEVIAGGFGLLKVSGDVLTALKLMSGLRGLKGGGAEAGTPGSGGSGGGLKRAWQWAGDKLSAVSEWIGGPLNGAALWDYAVNNTRIGQETRNTGDFFGAVKTAWNEKVEEVKKNWNDFWETSYWGEIGQMYADSLNKWTEDHSASNSSILGKPGQLMDEWDKLWGNEKVEIPTEPSVPETAAANIAEQIGIVPVQVQPVLSGTGYGGATGGGTMSLLRDFGNGLASLFGLHANGLWAVPFDNYPALLHRGKRVVPAREVSSRSYNSNLYVEKMYMSNGTDAQGLADAMAAANRRTVNSYGGG